MIRELYNNVFGSANWVQVSPNKVSVMRGLTEFTYMLDEAPPDDDYVMRRALITILNVNYLLPSTFHTYKRYYVGRMGIEKPYAIVKVKGGFYVVTHDDVMFYKNKVQALYNVKKLYGGVYV